MVVSNTNPRAGAVMENAHYGGYYCGDDTPKYKRCPVCDEKLAQGYLERGFHKLYSRGGEVVGCDVCTDEIDEYGEEYVA